LGGTVPEHAVVYPFDFAGFSAGASAKAPFRADFGMTAEKRYIGVLAKFFSNGGR
jgi:hypothetical protein